MFPYAVYWRSYPNPRRPELTTIAWEAYDRGDYSHPSATGSFDVEATGSRMTARLVKEEVLAYMRPEKHGSLRVEEPLRK